MPQKQPQKTPIQSILDLLKTNGKTYGSNKAPNKTNFSLIYFIIAFFIMLAINHYFSSMKVKNIPYSEFKELLVEGRVGDLTLSPGLIHGKIEPTIEEAGDADTGSKGRRGSFMTVRVADPDLTKELHKHGIKYRGAYESKWIKNILSWVLPILFIFILWSFFMKRMGPGSTAMSFGRSRAKIYADEKTGVTFNDVAGIDEAKEELMEIIEFLKSPEQFQSLGGNIPKGILLIGLPGTGKTMLAKAVAGEAKVPFFSLSGSDFVEMFVGVGAARVRDLFVQAQNQAPCIIFIDELDAIGKTRGANPLGGHDEREQTLNQLLVEMDGFETKKGVIIMAATNRPETLDPALLRPGRFDRQILVDRPDIKGREDILKVYAKNVKLAGNIDLKVIAARTPGFVGADLANVMNEAALLAARRKKNAVEMSDLEEAIDRVVAGLEKKNRLMNKKEKEIIAFHESGHALVAESLPTTDPVYKISIIPRGMAALGYTMQLPTEDRYLMTKSELLDRLAVLLGGRVAEEIIFNDASTGAQNDLIRATEIATSMVKEYGMSERLGKVTFEKEKKSPFLNQEIFSGKQYSEETAREIDEEVKKIIDETYRKAEELLKRNKNMLEKLARLLLEKEIIEGEDLREILGREVVKEAYSK